MCLSIDQLLAVAQNVATHHDISSSDRCFNPLPLFHINALMYSLGGAMACGGTLILIRKFSASAFWQQVSHYRASEVNVIMSAAASTTSETNATA